ncbi:P-loop containing nucleoside triphosphate hydrolase protein [Russula vinacea]|nr:P-loop containing nucleoside triphosphate hydrolase protein [Russula vinacea]
MALAGKSAPQGSTPQARLLKGNKIVSSLDDSVETKRHLEVLGELPAVDMTMADGEAGIGDLEVDDDDEDANRIDAESKAKAQAKAQNAMDVEEDDDVDPLDAFMDGVKDEVKKVNAEDLKKMVGSGRLPERGDDRMNEAGADDDDGELKRKTNILALAAKKARKKDLAAVDHNKIKYEPFRKEFYVPPPEVAAMTDEGADLLRLELDSIKIRGVECPRPVTKWSHFGLHASVLDVIKRLNYTAPTSIQAQAIPAIMSGRDVIGVAKTGSGKTIAFFFPANGIIMTPTRELAVQIYRDCKPFLKVLNLRAVCAYGGSPIKDQIADMKKGAEIIVCTPGRMIDLLTANSGRVTNLKRVTYLVLDEADRMFDMGFEPQKILKKPLEITVGGRSVVAAEIDQIVEVRAEDTKFNRLLEILGQMYNDDPEARTLIFVDRQEAADNLLRELLRKSYLAMSLHGGKDQVDRDTTISDFKSGVVPIVIATSVAARGLDVKQLKLVINYDAPNHMEDYVHRTCITFITPEQDRYSVDIYRALKASNATVPPELEELANESQSWQGTGAGSGFGGKGLDKLDKERDAREKAERKAYGEPEEEKAEVSTEKKDGDDMTFGNFKVEIKRGPAPDTTKGLLGVAGAAAAARRLAHAKEEEKMQSSLRAAEEAAARAGKDSAAHKQALSVMAKLNAQLRASKLALQAQLQAEDVSRKVNPDATDFHAIVPINDYPQKARWRVTNKETMVQLIDMTGASVTNKGIYYEPGKEPPARASQAPPSHRSNEEFRMRNPTAPSGRYSVV